MQYTDKSVDISEDDEQRSRYVQKLVQGTECPPFARTLIRARIPKVLVQYWHNLAEVPDDVQECLNSWDALRNQGFQSELFDDDRAEAFISESLGQRHVSAFDHCYHPAMRCDYFRLCYLLIRGGFYVDADEQYQGADCNSFFSDNKLKLQPLCYDIPTGQMIAADTFVRARSSSPDWIFYFNNNPIIAPSNHPVIKLALERAMRILLSGIEQPDIQSTTGPGNITASLIRHALASQCSGNLGDFAILSNWETVSITPWPLSYRYDERNWRLWPCKSKAHT